MKNLDNLSSIADQYDAFLLDLWGVVHDGTHLYPGAQEVMTQLKDAGKTIMLVSNAPRRCHKAVAVLKKLGVDNTLYDHIITSGELGYQWLKSGDCGYGKRYYYIGPSKDADVLDGLDFTHVDDIKQADFLLNVGFGSEEEIASDLMPLLRGAKGQGLPMLCLNPDFEVVKISGKRFECAGVIAADYARLGGEVTYFGKPYAAVYNYCINQLGGLDKGKILAIGDGIATDIKGAVDYGIDCIFVTGGIFKHQSASVEEICNQHDAKPQYVTPMLGW